MNSSHLTLFNAITHQSTTGKQVYATLNIHSKNKIAKNLKARFDADENKTLENLALIALIEDLKQLAIMGSDVAQDFYMGLAVDDDGYLHNSTIEKVLYAMFCEIAWTTQSARFLLQLYRLLAPTAVRLHSHIVPDIKLAMKALELAAVQKCKYAVDAALVLARLYVSELTHYPGIEGICERYLVHRDMIVQSQRYNRPYSEQVRLMVNATQDFVKLGSRIAVGDFYGSPTPLNIGETQATYHKLARVRYLRLAVDNIMKYGFQMVFDRQELDIILITKLICALVKSDEAASPGTIHEHIIALAKQGYAHAAYYLAFSASCGTTIVSKNYDEAKKWYHFILELPSIDADLSQRVKGKLAFLNVEPVAKFMQ